METIEELLKNELEVELGSFVKQILVRMIIR